MTTKRRDFLVGSAAVAAAALTARNAAAANKVPVLGLIFPLLSLEEQPKAQNRELQL